MKIQVKLKEKKAKVIKQSQKEHPASPSALKKLQVNQGKIGRTPLETNMLGLHDVILRHKAFYIQNQLFGMRQKKATKAELIFSFCVLLFYSSVIVAVIIIIFFQFDHIMYFHV